MLNNGGKILFFSDGAKGESGAIQRAHSLASRLNSELIVMAVVREVSTSDRRLEHNIRRIQKTIVQERSLEVDKLIAGIDVSDDPRVKITRLVSIGRDYEEVIKHASEIQAQLIIKSANSEQAIRNVLFGDADLRLIHFSECPVMILKSSRRRSMKSVLVTIDPFAKEKADEEFNAQILGCGGQIAEMENAELHLLHVVESIAKTRGAGDAGIKELETVLKAEAESQLSKMVAETKNTEINEHVLKGRPHTTIRKFADENEVDLLVMGSIGRSGVRRVLIGNTAERILGHVDCSVLVVKPEGWHTPIFDK